MSPRISIRLLSAQSDQRLVALAREGHERAFETLVHRYRRPLLRYARRMRLSEARSEDVLQQAFMQSWLALSRGVEVRDVRGWLYRIVHNTAVNAMRGPGAAHAELTQAVQDRAGLRAASNLERTIAIRDALGHVAELPDMQRQAIFLTAVDGQSHEEVAGTLGISTGALRGLLYRARHTLRSAAAALTPQPLLELAARGAGDAAAPGTERLAELAGGGVGAAGFVGLLLKGGAAAVTVGALATGAVLTDHGPRNSYPHHAAVAAGGTAIGRTPPARDVGAVLLASSSPSRAGWSTSLGDSRRPAHPHRLVSGRGHRGMEGLAERRGGLAPSLREAEGSRALRLSGRGPGRSHELEDGASQGKEATGAFGRGPTGGGGREHRDSAGRTQPFGTTDSSGSGGAWEDGSATGSDGRESSGEPSLDRSGSSEEDRAGSGSASQATAPSSQGAAESTAGTDGVSGSGSGTGESSPSDQGGSSGTD